MSELERARAHMLHRQEMLQTCRSRAERYSDYEVVLESYENAFLAAISWVWLEQERERCMRYMLPMRWASYPSEAPFS